MTELMLGTNRRTKPLQPATHPSTLQGSPVSWHSWRAKSSLRIWILFFFFFFNWNMAFMCRGYNDWVWEGLKEKKGRSLLPPAHPQSPGFGQGVGFGPEKDSKTWDLKTGEGRAEHQLVAAEVSRPPLHPWVLSAHLQPPLPLQPPPAEAQILPVPPNSYPHPEDQTFLPSCKCSFANRVLL